MKNYTTEMRVTSGRLNLCLKPLPDVVRHVILEDGVLYGSCITEAEAIAACAHLNAGEAQYAKLLDGLKKDGISEYDFIDSNSAG